MTTQANKFASELRAALLAPTLDWSLIWNLIARWPEADPSSVWAQSEVAKEAAKRRQVSDMLATWRAHQAMLSPITQQGEYVALPREVLETEMYGRSAAHPPSLAARVAGGGIFTVNTQTGWCGNLSSSGSATYIVDLGFQGMDRTPTAYIEDADGLQLAENVTRLGFALNGHGEHLALIALFEHLAEELRHTWLHTPAINPELPEELERYLQPPDEPDDGDE